MKWTILLVLFFAACGGTVAVPPSTPAPEPVVESTNLVALEKRLADATERGDEIARLSVLKDIIAEKLRQSDIAAITLRAQLKAADSAVVTERTSQAQTKAYWFVGIMGLAALAFAALAIFVPSVTKWAIKAAIACGVVSALAIVFAWMIPYLFWIGIAVIGLAAIAAIIYWRLDAKSRDQVVMAVDKIKHRVPEYKTIFNGVIDHDADLAINAARKRLKL